ncbi:hypothetical protein JZU61_05330 [bacterium]|nr:hypothetical protein [bacterium]
MDKRIKKRIERQIGECVKELNNTNKALSNAGQSFMYFSNACSTIMPVDSITPIVLSAN